MKKLALTLCMILVFSLLLSPLCYAAGDNYDTLADWDIKIAVPDGTTAVLQGRNYYIYAQHDGSIPYVMLTVNRYASEEEFFDAFTPYMKQQYSDLKVTSDMEKVAIGDKTGYEMDYSYKVSGHDVTDRRIAIALNGLVYMFASKEVEDLGMTIGTMLEDVIADCEFLNVPAAEPGPTVGVELPDLEEEIKLSTTYLYCQDDGMPKYWLDLTGTVIDNLVLHCYFRSGDPSFYETFFILDLDTADVRNGRVKIHDIYNENGYDVSDWFRSLEIRFADDSAQLVVKRNEKTLAGGGDDNILTGSYPMQPMRAALDYAYYQDDGQLKYWVDMDGEDVLLHANFISDSPEYYETVFTLDMETADVDDYTIAFHKIIDSHGLDISKWFKSFTLTQVQGALMMNVKRDEKTLAGGAGDNILTGVYLLEPRPYLQPLKDGPYIGEELGRWAQIYYFIENGFYPPEVEVIENDDGSFTIHLFEIVDLDGVTHTATSAWYTVDEYGYGTNDILEQPIQLVA